MFIYLITLFLIAFTTLMLELALARVFDVILTSNMSYMILTSAIFAFGLSGIFVTIRPLSAKQDVRKLLSFLTLLFAVSALLLLPIMNALPFDYEKLTEEPVHQIVYFGGMYLTLLVPFFLSGLIFVYLFSLFAEKIQSLYFWDLSGAALGSVILIPFLPEIGPGGILFCVSALALVAFAILTRIKSYRFIALLSSAILVLTPFLHSPNYFEFVTHIDKRGVREANVSHKVEYSVWDPVSKIDVIDQTLQPSNGIDIAITRKHIAYDGGSQSSHIYKFDGDFTKLRENVLSTIEANFWNRGVLASHYLKHDTRQEVLIIGSAAGQETKAALLYNAALVDAVEMVGAVVTLGKGKYAEFNGNIFNHENVHVHIDEGRSFIRRSERKYDIIQIFSNHTSSSIASGTGAVQTTYLQTAEAYEEYFNHLKPDGVLHINHHIFPKMVTTAALAWHNMGLRNFQKHVVIFARKHIKDNLPTILIKMEPWQEEEIEELKNFFLTDEVKDGFEYELVEDPIHPRASFLSSEFYSGEFSKQLADRIPYHVAPSTDDRPYFNFLRKSIVPLTEDKLTYIDRSTAMLLNSQLRKDIIPMDSIHFFVIGSISIIFTGLFIFIPLSFSTIGKAKWPNKFFSLTYFSCIGAGFIIIEVVFIQIFMKLIGSPLYTYSTVIFSLLLSAGVGSLCSQGLKINLNKRWYWPFVGILLACCLLIFSHTSIFNVFMKTTLFVRIAAAALMIFPLGFFLGMPFPLGILSLSDKPKGAVAWAWGMNGLFTVIGGFSTILISIFFGFKLTLLFSLVCYSLAFATFSRIRRSALLE